MINRLLVGVCAAALSMPATAWAQSTGSQEVEDAAEAEGEEVVVTGTRASNGVDGIIVPDVPKTRSVLEQEIINRQPAGQSILNTINLIPSVNYTNTDPYGGSGGNLRIRGFPGNRVALLWDGLPLNDTGNYAIFGNQQFDPELMDQVSVNLGTTDVDSPTPSAAGGVVSYRTRLPERQLSSMGQYSRGTFDYNRAFGVIHTGVLEQGGLRGFIAGSSTRYEKFRGPGEIDKEQYNARLHRELGDNGDFLSLSGHWNSNRNNSYNNGLLTDYAVNRRFDNIATCARDLGTTGVVDNDNAGLAANAANPASCTNFFELRVNPSDTGNVRAAGRFSLTDSLVLTVDPGYQYVLANGGGTGTISERDDRLRGAARATGIDLNRDGDTLDTVRLYQPSNTQTDRFTFLTSLIYQVTEQHRLRLAYTFDRGNHRQTGEFGFLDDAGVPLSVFGGKYSENARVLTADGEALQNRDRRSIALLNQISGEYFGRFFDERLTFTAGLRAPFFERGLDQNCFTVISTGNPTCTDAPIAANLIIDPSVPRSAALPTGAVYAPFERTVRYSPLLPSAGVQYEVLDGHKIYASYGRNFSSPSTDSLYRAVNLDLTPETTDAFDVGYRFTTRRVQAQVAAYYTDYQNRIVTATDQDPTSQTFGTTQDRNVGDANAYGLDAQVAWQPIPELTLYAYGAYIETELEEDVPAAVVNGVQTFLNTSGAEFVETPKYQFGGRAQVDLGPASLAAQFKYVGKRFATDDNGRAGIPAAIAATGFVDSRGRISDYTTVDLDARISLAPIGLQRSYLSLNVINVFDEFYFGNINTQNTFAGGPRFSVGSPRTFQGTLRFGF